MTGKHLCNSFAIFWPKACYPHLSKCKLCKFSWRYGDEDLEWVHEEDDWRRVWAKRAKKLQLFLHIKNVIFNFQKYKLFPPVNIQNIARVKNITIFKSLLDQGHVVRMWRQISKKFLVWLCWKGCRPPSTHWRGPTTDPHGDSWLLALAPGPVRPSSSNLNPSDSSVGPMLMRALVRTPDQHDPMTNRVPSLKPSLKLAS